MAVIGVGRAYREQSRAAEARRTHRTPRDERRDDDAETPAVAETCRLCGRSDFVLATEDGPTCLGCQDDAPDPDPTRGLWAEVLVPVGSILLTLVVFNVIPVPEGPKRGGAWAVAFCMAVVASAVSFPSGLRLTRSPHPTVRRLGYGVTAVSGAQLVALLGLAALAVVWAFLS